MRKLLFLSFTAVMMTLSSSAFAGRYTSLKFTSNTGETYDVATNNLEILVEGDNLTFSNTDLRIPLASLVSMEFEDYDNSTSLIYETVFDGNSPVLVFNINGTPIGHFTSYSQALGSLSQGLYVIKDANGNSIKLSVEK